jgi:invasion protein IalB
MGVLDMRRLAVVLLLILCAPYSAAAEKRVALVIGNSAYKHAGELANPRNDAVDMAGALKQLGFEVVQGFDLDKPSFDRKVREFGTALSNADAGLFFYAGHGLQVAGKNYLVPIDAELTTTDALEFEMVELDVVHRIMERHAATNVVFLDACRNNPLTRNLARAMGTRSAAIGQGLAQAESGIGTLISFSTQPGNVALDGVGRNSPFSGALAKRILQSNDDLSAILIDVRNDVRKLTGGKQVPWEHSALTGRFYFKHPSPSATSQEPSPPPIVAPLPPQDEPIAVTLGESAWVKLCENATQNTGAQPRQLRICLTHHERLDGSSGMVLVSAAIRQVEGQGSQHLMVMVPLGMLQAPGIKATIYTQDLWRKAQNKETIDEKDLLLLRLKFTLCHPAGCTAELEATPDVIEWMRRGGGMMVYAINAEGKPVAFPVPFNGFAAAYAGPPVDSKAYSEARQKLMAQIAERQQKAAKAKPQKN